MYRYVDTGGGWRLEVSCCEDTVVEQLLLGTAFKALGTNPFVDAIFGYRMEKRCDSLRIVPFVLTPDRGVALSTDSGVAYICVGFARMR